MTDPIFHRDIGFFLFQLPFLRLVQSTINVVAVRFTIFFLSTLCLIGLTTHAGLRILHECGIIG